ncbi:hypothetical protein ACJX0J_017624, partial [Zea mays]
SLLQIPFSLSIKIPHVQSLIYIKAPKFIALVKNIYKIHLDVDRHIMESLFWVVTKIINKNYQFVRLEVYFGFPIAATLSRTSVIEIEILHTQAPSAKKITRSFVYMLPRDGIGVGECGHLFILDLGPFLYVCFKIEFKTS